MSWWLPERDRAKTDPWVVLLTMERVASQENKELVGARQVRAILEDAQLPFQQDLCVEVEDSAYSFSLSRHFWQSALFASGEDGVRCTLCAVLNNPTPFAS